MGLTKLYREPLPRDPTPEAHRCVDSVLIRSVLFVSQARAEEMEPTTLSGLISITDTDKPPARLKAGWATILRISFDDIDPVTYPDDYEGMQAISETQALAIGSFVTDVIRSCRTLVVHCRYGVARSAAVAKAAAEYANLDFPADYAEHNNYVYEAVRKALRQCEK